MEIIEFSKAILNASQTYKFSVITLDKTRTVGITAKTTYNASGTGSLRVNLYYSPDGINFDTIAYTYFDVTITAATTQQRTAIVDIPEIGYMQIAIQNLDATYTQTNVQAWVTQEKWEEVK